MAATDPLGAVQQYIAAFNKGDADGMAEVFSVTGSILDGMPPHLWLGSTATRDWYRDVLIEGEQHGASEYFVTLGEPLHHNITGDSAYVVAPATMFTVRRLLKPAHCLRWRCEEWRKTGASRPGPGQKGRAHNRGTGTSREISSL